VAKYDFPLYVITTFSFGGALHTYGDNNLLTYRQSLEIYFLEIIKETEHVGSDGYCLHSLIACRQSALTLLCSCN